MRRLVKISRSLLHATEVVVVVEEVGVEEVLVEQEVGAAVVVVAQPPAPFMNPHLCRLENNSFIVDLSITEHYSYHYYDICTSKDDDGK